MDRITAESLSFEGPTPSADEIVAIAAALEAMRGDGRTRHCSASLSMFTLSSGTLRPPISSSAWKTAMRESILEQ